jgi:hypothetical protein
MSNNQYKKSKAEQHNRLYAAKLAKEAKGETVKDKLIRTLVTQIGKF